MSISDVFAINDQPVDGVGLWEGDKSEPAAAVGDGIDLYETFFHLAKIRKIIPKILRGSLLTQSTNKNLRKDDEGERWGVRTGRNTWFSYND